MLFLIPRSNESRRIEETNVGKKSTDDEIESNKGERGGKDKRRVVTVRVQHLADSMRKLIL